MHSKFTLPSPPTLVIITFSVYNQSPAFDFLILRVIVILESENDDLKRTHGSVKEQHRRAKKPGTRETQDGEHSKEADRASLGDADAEGAHHSHATTVHRARDKSVKS